MNIKNKTEFIEKTRAKNKLMKGYKRLENLFDDGKFDEISSLVKSGEDYAGIFCGFGLVDGRLTYAFSQNPDEDGGAVSEVTLYKMKKVYDLALKTGLPLIGIYDSIGARLEEGNKLVSAFGEILTLSSNLSGIVPQISIILGPCVGTNSMLAATSDFVIMQKSALLGINTDGTNNSYEFAKKDGVCDIIADDEQSAILKAKGILKMLPANNLDQVPVNKNETAFMGQPDFTYNDICTNTDSDEIFKIINSICDFESFIELSPNFGKSIVTGIACLGGSTVSIIAANGFYNNGFLDANACIKAEKLVRFSDSFSIPIINLVNSKGFSSLKEAIKLSKAYLEATTVKLTVIIGEACSHVYIAQASQGTNADIILAWPNAVLSALATKTEIEIMQKDSLKNVENPMLKREKLEEEYKNTTASAIEAATNGFIDDIIFPSETREKLFSCLDVLMGKRVIKFPKK